MLQLSYGQQSDAPEVLGIILDNLKMENAVRGCRASAPSMFGSQRTTVNGLPVDLPISLIRSLRMSRTHCLLHSLYGCVMLRDKQYDPELVRKVSGCVEAVLTVT